MESISRVRSADPILFLARFLDDKFRWIYAMEIWSEFQTEFNEQNEVQFSSLLNGSWCHFECSPNVVHRRYPFIAMKRMTEQNEMEFW